MGAFIQLLQQEIIATIEGLTGSKPILSPVGKEDNKRETLLASFIVLDINVKGDMSGKIRISLTPSIAAHIADMMQGGEGQEKAPMSEETSQATKRMLSDIFSSLELTLKSQKNMSQLAFEAENIQTMDTMQESDLEAFDKFFLYTIYLDNMQGMLAVAFSEEVASLVLHEQNTVPKTVHTMTSIPKKSPFLGQDDLGNIDLIKDVKLPVRVRIGSKKMLLKDVLNMDIGSVIELDQLANDPLEILVGDKVIATGNVVIVDGNFGIQIGEIGTRRERLEKLR